MIAVRSNAAIARQILRALCGVAIALSPGCRSISPATSQPTATQPANTDATGLAPARCVLPVDSICRPPIGWTAEAMKRGKDDVRQVWISPTGRTAYGVIHANLPWPVGHELTLWGFLQNMKRQEGQARLLSKQWDASADCLRFDAVGARYHVRSRLMAHGVVAWVVFAGTLSGQADDADELALAVRAREATVVDVSPKTPATAPSRPHR